MNNFLISISKLRAFKDNLPGDRAVEEKYVHLFNDLVNEISSQVKFNSKEFTIPDSGLAPQVTGVGFEDELGDRPLTYSRERFCDRHLLLIRVDSILNYLDLLLHEEPRTIGIKSTNS